MTNQELVACVKTYAQYHYNKGWDVVVECFDDAEILEAIGKARTAKGAIKKVAKHVGIWNERKQEVESTIW